MTEEGRETQELGEACAREEMKGPIAWMACNSVAANLLMFALLAGGLLMALQVKQEVFPEFEIDIIRVTVPYPGATPEEVEQGIILATEEAVQGLDGVKKVTATATENLGSVVIELLTGADPDQVLSDVKNEIDRIRSYPAQAEEPTISRVSNRNHVISVVVHGQMPRWALRDAAEEIRRGLLDLEEIVLVEIPAVPPPEVSIEVPRRALRAHGLTLEQIAQVVRATSIELTGGAIRTDGGEILVRTAERRELADDFGNLTLLSTREGGRVRLGDVATVRDTYRQTDQEATYRGRPAVKIDVFRVGDQTPTQVARAVTDFVEEARSRLPGTVGLATWDDQSEIFADRIGLLLRNGALGLVLVFLVLGAFLELRLAFWVMLGIAISLLGSFVIFPVFGVSINMISLFAFIITLGIVVDDAIIVGENTYYRRQEGAKPIPAAIQGARQVGKPVIFAVLTSVVAFSPMLFVPGFAGKIFRVIPIIVISVLTLSLVESLFILPAHLGHSRPEEPHGFWATLRRPQKMVSQGLEWFVEHVYQDHVGKAIRHRYLTIAGAVALLLVAVGIMVGGRLPFVFMPNIESAIVAASVRLPVDAPLSEARRIRDLFVREGRALGDTLEEEEGVEVLQGIYAQIGSVMGAGGPAGGLTAGETGAHVIEIAMQLVGPDRRRATTPEIAERWREAVGHPTGVRTLAFNYNTGPGAGADITIQLQHPNTGTLEAAASSLAARMEEYAGITNVDPGFAGGKPQLDLTLKPAARALGLTEAGMARQVRSALFGAEALRQQRGRYEMRVMVRLPEEDRERVFGLEQFRLRTPAGGELPLTQAAHIRETRSHTAINRVNGRRVLNVSADAEEGAVTGRILERIQEEVLPDLEETYVGLSHQLVGQQEDLQESVSSLMVGFAGALIVIYALLAIPFGSYVQPFIVMTAIPFGFIGAIIGHLLLGYMLSLISLMGLVALAGVVVNDSLLLIVRANELRAEGKTIYEAVVGGGMRRFRPIILTSLTTFFGLAPLIFEGSVQARYLIPMAISLGFGILFATGIVLILVPSIYMVVEDLRGLLHPEHETPEEERKRRTDREAAGAAAG